MLRKNRDLENVRINNVNLRRFGQIKGYSSGFKRDQEDADVRILHKVVDRALPLRRRHRAIQHDGVEAGSTQAPFDQLQHGRELREDDALGHPFRAPHVREIHDQHLDLRR